LTPASAWTTRPARLPRGAFFGSIHATLNHLLWGDTMWLGRFAAQGEASDALPTGLLALPAGGQVTTLLMQAGVDVGVTDLIALV
jgi:uncharacterized damage-inducible protein DinB